MRRSFPTTLMIVWMCGFSACTPFSLAPAVLPPAVTAPTPPALAGELGAHLEATRWEPAITRSVQELVWELADRPQSAASEDPFPPRWKLTSPALSKNDESESAPPRDAEEWLLDPATGTWADKVGAALHLVERREWAGYNAAVVLARRHPGDAQPLLRTLETIVCERPHVVTPPATVGPGEAAASAASAVAGKPVPLSLQCAAAEAWCRVLAAQSGDPLVVWRPVGEKLEAADLPEDLRLTLWRGAGDRIAPDRLPGLSESFLAGPGDARDHIRIRAAMETCLIHAWSFARAAGTAGAPADAWPDGIARARYHTDPLVRRLYGRWVALTRPAEAVEVLVSQERDSEWRVQEDAIRSLGLCTDPAADQELNRLSKDGGEVQRLIALGALGRRSPAAIAAALGDASPKVRAGAIVEAKRWPSPQTAALLRGALEDHHLDVQQAVLTAVRSWPDDLATAIVLESLVVSSGVTRRAALEQLRDRYGFEPAFPLDAPPDERRSAVQQLATQHQWPREFSTDATATAALQPANPVDADRLKADFDRWRDSLLTETPDRDLLDRLIRTAPDGIALMEGWTLPLPAAERDRVVAELLNPVVPLYRSIGELGSRDVNARRHAARRVAEHAESATLPPLAVDLIAAAVVSEQDQLVWQALIRGLLPDDSAPAARIAQLALHHQWPDIQKLGLDYLARHPHPEYAGWLIPLFEHPQRALRLQAVEVAGRCGNPAALGVPTGGSSLSGPGLRSLLATADAESRLTILVSMAQLRDETAYEEIVRLTYHPHPATREDAVAAMGRTGQSRFVEPLIRLGWTEQADPVRRQIDLALRALVPPDEHPTSPPAAGAPTPARQMELWGEWWRRRHGGGSPADGIRQ